MYNRIYNYLTKHQLLYNKQFGFQSNNSTDHAILHLVEDISNAFDRGEFTLFLLTYPKHLTPLITIYYYRNYKTMELQISATAGLQAIFQIVSNL